MNAKNFLNLAVMVSLVLAMLDSLRAGTFDEANRAFAEGHYSESIRQFQAVLEEKGYSAPVLFDLGNAYLENQQWGEAILAYKRARWLAPHDPDIAANLRYAQKKAGLVAVEASWYETAFSGLSPNAWAWLGSLSLCVLCATVFLTQILVQTKSIRWGALVSGLVVLLSGFALVERCQQGKEVVVLAKDAPVLISPFASAKQAFTLPTGQSVTVSNSYQDYLLVSDEAGHVGWIAKNQVGRIY